MKVLVVEDNPKLARFLAKVLREDGLTVDICRMGTDAIERTKTLSYDLILLDWMLPDIDGVAVCRQLRLAGTTAPVIMVTARTDVEEKVLGLGAGADDYVAKPFDVRELLARVRAVMRRASSMGRVQVGKLALDPVARRVSLDGETLDLTTREYGFVVYLAQRVDLVVGRSELLAQVWETTFDPSSNLVDVQVSRLRDKLGEHAWMIETVRGVGYRLRSKRA
ncbi:MAG TPA: response regulator transcription factor [Polyangiaceae bacterium]|nr:response regulator transcription factor [Polyangiaceae bacterium]